MSKLVLMAIVGLPMNEGRILLAGLQVQDVWERSIQLLKLRSEDVSGAEWLQEWRGRVDPLRAKRNDAVHAVWLPTDDDTRQLKSLDLSSRRSLGKGVREDLFPAGGADLAELAEKIHAASREQDEWFMGPLRQACLPYLRGGS
jgi:hypothetical protein